jgi:hypothetical protein
MMNLIACILNFGVLNDETAGEGFSSASSIITFIVLIASVGLSFVLLTKNRHRLKEEAIKDRFGELYKDLKPFASNYSLAYNIF